MTEPTAVDGLIEQVNKLHTLWWLTHPLGGEVDEVQDQFNQKLTDEVSQMLDEMVAEAEAFHAQFEERDEPPSSPADAEDHPILGQFTDRSDEPKVGTFDPPKPAAQTQTGTDVSTQKPAPWWKRAVLNADARFGARRS